MNQNVMNMEQPVGIGRPSGAEVRPMGMMPPQEQPSMMQMQAAAAGQVAPASQPSMEESRPKSGLTLFGYTIPWWLVVVVALVLLYWLCAGRNTTNVVYTVSAPLAQPATTPGPGVATELMTKA